jgi:hypothetical protein
MNTLRRARLGIASVAVLTLLAVLPARAQDTEARIRSLVRSLGYGASIHDFKNYVLRGAGQYRVDADRFLEKAAGTVADLRGSKSLRADERQALDAIASVIGAYRANLTVAQKMLKDGRSIPEIDAAVRVDDARAAEGLAALRKGRTWTALDNLEAALGYSGAIHDFKNYVLRGREEYRTNAAAHFQEVSLQIGRLRSDTSLGEREKKAVDDLDGVVRKYEANLEVVRRMIDEKKSVADIDAAVKVDDTKAIAALAVLRK